MLNGKTAVVGHNSIQRAAFMHEKDVIQFKGEILSGALRLALKKEGKTQCSKVTGIPQKCDDLAGYQPGKSGPPILSSQPQYGKETHVCCAHNWCHVFKSPIPSMALGTVLILNPLM